ncbi:MAG: DUF58 domain-containing protein [Pseudomonadota bacterium]
MFSRVADKQAGSDPTRLTLEDLIAIQPQHVRGKLSAGRRGPEGERPGRGRSTTLDFDGLSPYAPGDDVRAIDWRATMRTGQTTMRRFAAASHRAHMLHVDLRADLYFGTSERLMAKTACLATAWVAWKCFMLQEPVGLSVGSVTIAPRRGRKHVLRLLDTLTEAYVREGTDAQSPIDFEEISALVSRQDEICVISDLPVDPAPFAAAGRALSRTRMLRFVLVEDPMVLRPAVRGRYPLRGPDGQRQVIRIAAEKPNERLVEAELRDAGWQMDRASDLLPRWGAE